MWTVISIVIVVVGIAVVLAVDIGLHVFAQGIWRRLARRRPEQRFPWSDRTGT
jgi:hypothetical protein